MGIHVSLPDELELKIHQKVSTGMYGSASEVVREALRNFFAGDTATEEVDITDEEFLTFFGPMIEEADATPDEDYISWDELQAGKDKIRQKYHDNGQ